MARPSQPVGRRRVLLDVTPLRESRDYRSLYVGQSVSTIGRQLTVVAVRYSTTRSAAIPGSGTALGGAQLASS